MTDETKAGPVPARSPMEGLGDEIAQMGAVILKLKTNGSGTDDAALSELERQFGALRRAYEYAERSVAAPGGVEGEAAGGEIAAQLEQVRSQTREAWRSAQQHVGKAYEGFRTFAKDRRTQEAIRRNQETLMAGLRDIRKDAAVQWDRLSKTIERVAGRAGEDAPDDGKTSEGHSQEGRSRANDERASSDHRSDKPGPR